MWNASFRAGKTAPLQKCSGAFILEFSHVHREIVPSQFLIDQIMINLPDPPLNLNRWTIPSCKIRKLHSLGYYKRSKFARAQSCQSLIRVVSATIIPHFSIFCVTSKTWSCHKRKVVKVGVFRPSKKTRNGTLRFAWNDLFEPLNAFIAFSNK